MSQPASLALPAAVVSSLTMSERIQFNTHELLYGAGVITYRGLLSGPDEPQLLPPGTMTRQRRRAAARAAAKR